MAESRTMLDVSGMQVRRGPQLVVRDASFVAARGEIVALMGASGAGKTSVLRAVGGLEPIAAGAVSVDGLLLPVGQLPHGETRQALHRRVGIVFQFHHLFEHLTALHNVWLAPVHVLRQPPAEAEHRARQLLEALGIGARAGALPRELSGGEAQRVAIARALAVDPPVLLMDEPTASLDPARRGELAGTLRDLAADGRAIVIATHDREFVESCAHRVVLMEDGRTVSP